MFPLPLFPTIADDLEAMDSRQSVQHMNTFMKNTLIRGVNNVYDTASHVNNDRLAYHFLRYATVVFDILRVHIEGDQKFFSTKNAKGTSLVDFLGIADSYAAEFSVLYSAVQGMQKKLQSWIKCPATYSSVEFRKTLETFSKPMLQSMTNQRKALDRGHMMKFCAEPEMRGMITDNLHWLASHSDVAVLLPFVLSHHDPATSARWPNVAPEGLKLVPEFVNKDPICWAFARFDPITKQKRSSRTLPSV
ncbi:hypothetical protein LshimejAT787_0403850 [Lyophyllum shimeji]|uniref:Uncharacterized protein n=1 Tax=Lyophyllum shimeji TaxID=47721 RepID=A0A9P3PKY1_LYOSH|nr:hypothetical protein LshimejAT787_0403850 [Lyophyllum shimeji]